MMPSIFQVSKLFIRYLQGAFHEDHNPLFLSKNLSDYCFKMSFFCRKLIIRNKTEFGWEKLEKL